MKSILFVLMCVIVSLAGPLEVIDIGFGHITSFLAPILFFNIFDTIPFIVLVLISGGVFFTFRYGFAHFKLFGHAFAVVRGKFDDPNDQGQISHFKALTSALSATVGIGNIAGVAVAISAGGPGAIFWMWVTAFFGISMKFTSCTLAQIYRSIDGKGQVLGGPMVYIKEGFKNNFPRVGLFLSGLFAVFTIMGSFGGGNLFQVNQTYELLSGQIPILKDYPLVVGIVLAMLVGFVIIGGIARIGEVTSRLVPTMCGFYVLVCLYIILTHITQVPYILGLIFSEAFNGNAVFGGLLGVIIQGIKRASFSNEAGLGSAAIAHSAAKTKEPVREGVVAMLGPFIDTHIVCTMTAITLLITGVYQDPSLSGKGAQMTAEAFRTAGSWLPLMLTIATCVFAYSTIISWAYYGQTATKYLFKSSAVKVYQIIYVSVVVFGPLLSLKNVIEFSDLMLLSMAFPNIIGMVLLSGIVKEKLLDYIARFKATH